MLCVCLTEKERERERENVKLDTCALFVDINDICTMLYSYSRVTAYPTNGFIAYETTLIAA